MRLGFGSCCAHRAAQWRRRSVFGVAWLAVYGTLAVLQGAEARVTDTFLALAGTAIGYAASMILGKRADEEPDIVVASAEPAAPGSGWLRLAASLYVFLGLAFGASAPFVLAFYADNGYLPMMFSFRALAGPVEELGRTEFLAAGFALIASSAVSVVAGLLLWRGQRRGVQLGLLVDPVVFALGLGFALPLLLIGVPVRVGLVLVGMWQARRGTSTKPGNLEGVRSEGGGVHASGPRADLRPAGRRLGRRHPGRPPVTPRAGELPMSPFGWRLLGGPYPQIGTDRLTPLGWALAWLLIAVSIVDVLIGRWLWRDRSRGAALALVMAPVSFALGWRPASAWASFRL